ncbi:MAG: RNA 2',3'-cyclic phosphodiesterase [Hylemonella sp.]
MQQDVETPTAARLFLALVPGGPVRAELSAHIQAWRWNDGAQRYAPPDWHVTLHFIGLVPRTRLDELRAGLSQPFTPFELRFGEPALWPHGLAVLLPMAMPPALQVLHDRLGAQLRRLGLRTDERPYRPHLTLARRAEQAVPPAPPAWGWRVRGYVLMESTGRPEARYRVLQRFDDRGQDDGATA